MKRAKDFRALARASLRGNWGSAVLVCFLAGLLGAGSGSVASGMTANLGPLMKSETMDEAMEAFQSVFTNPAFLSMMAGIGIVAFLFALAWSALGSTILLGQHRFFIALAQDRKASVSLLFSRFTIFFRAWGLQLMMGLFIFLWGLIGIVPSLVFVVLAVVLKYPLMILPGIPFLIVAAVLSIIAQYRYAMAPYLMAQSPELTVLQAIGQSKQIMNGNKGRFFCLGFSFIGWVLLLYLVALVAVFLIAILVAFAGSGVSIVLIVLLVLILLAALILFALFFTPYVCAAQAVFYLDVSGQADTIGAGEPSSALEAVPAESSGDSQPPHGDPAP